MKIMKKTLFLGAFIALSLTSLVAQNCSTATATKMENTVAVMTDTPQNALDRRTEKTAETTPMTAVDKPIMMEKTVEAVAQTTPQKPTQIIDNKAINSDKKIKTAAFDHSVWNDLLKKHVSATGKVNYKTFKGDLELLDTYMRSLNEGAPSETASKEERLAYWINAYNAVTVRLIIANYPLSSITKLDGGKPWDVKRYSNDGKKLSLNDIENNILRPMGDARIHFALNCAAKSCPPLLNEAFTADNVNKLLEQRTKQFINSSRTVIEKGEIKVSKIFDWYGKDFGNIVNFVNKYAKTKADKTAKVTYLEYDWNLND
jgi:hypothetical protein